jgi:hypothetical protein
MLLRIVDEEHIMQQQTSKQHRDACDCLDQKKKAAVHLLFLSKQRGVG